MDFDVRRSVIQVLDNFVFTSSKQANKQTRFILYALPSVEGTIENGHKPPSFQFIMHKLTFSTSLDNYFFRVLNSLVRIWRFKFPRVGEGDKLESADD